MHEYRFDADTAVRRIDERTFEVELDGDWNVDGRILNGGYLQAVVTRAALDAYRPTAQDASSEAPMPRPVAVSSAFAAPPIPGRAVVEVEVLRSGRSLGSVAATLRQSGAAVLASLVTVGPGGAAVQAGEAAGSPSGHALSGHIEHAADAGHFENAGRTEHAGGAGHIEHTEDPKRAAPASPDVGPSPQATTRSAEATSAAAFTTAHATATTESHARATATPRTTAIATPDADPSVALAMPTVPDAAQCIRVPVAALPGPPGLASLVDYAFVPETSAWLTGHTGGAPRITCWLDFADGRPIDTLAAVALVDMAPPVCFAQGVFGWAPTLQLQVGIFAAPAPGPVLLDLRGAPYDGEIVAEDGLLWDSRGALIARSRQIARAPRR